MLSAAQTSSFIANRVKRKIWQQAKSGKLALAEYLDLKTFVLSMATVVPSKVLAYNLTLWFM